MRLNHLTLLVEDVAGTRDFLQKYFDMKNMGKPTDHMSFLTDDNGMVMGIFKSKGAQYPEGFHIGFIQPSEEKVNEIHQQMIRDGLEAESPRKLHGSWTFYYRCPGGFLVEVLH